MMAMAAPARATETREMPTLMLRADVQASTFDAEQRTVEIIWTTGARGLRRRFWEDDYIEELVVDDESVRLERLNNGAPLLAAHDSWTLDSVIGVVERAWIENGIGKAIVRFSERTEVQAIMRDVQTGILRNISVGYNVHRYEITREDDAKIDTYRAVDWEPMELSIVPIGFDDGAKVRSAENQKLHQVTISRGAAAFADEVREMPNENGAAAGAGAVDPKEVEAVRSAAAAAAVKAERARVAEIRSAVEKAGLGTDLAERLESEGVDIDAARAQIIDAMADKQKKEQPQIRGQHVDAGQDEAEKWVEGARNSIIERAGLRPMFGEEGKRMSSDGFRGMSLMELARDYLQRQGVNTRNMDKMQLAGAAFTHRGSGAYNGVSDFAVLLENVMHKTLLGAFAVTPDTWRRFCRVGSVSDFRAHNRYRLGTFGVLDKVNEHGEFKQKNVPDGQKETISIDTKGNIVGLTRQVVINDDLGAFNDIAVALGRAAALSIEVDVYAALALNGGLGPLLADSNPIFHNRTGANNIVTGAALSAAALDLDRQALASMKDISGNEFLDLRPDVMLVSLALGSTARQINTMEFDDEATKYQRRPNTSRGMFRDIVDTPRLSGTRRYIFADPAIAPVLEVAFLDGQQTPFLDNQTGWRVDGTEWKVRMDYGVAGIGYHGAVTNAGA